MKIPGLLKVALLGCSILLILNSCNPSGKGTTTPPANDTVTMSQMQFHPAELYINKWDTIVWINDDIVTHDVTEQPDKSWTSDSIAVGHSWKTTLGETTDYFCSIHPTMKGKIIVRSD